MSKKDLPVLPYLDGPLSHPFYSRVIKRGTHEELMKAGGAYADLVANE